MSPLTVRFAACMTFALSSSIHAGAIIVAPSGGDHATIQAGLDAANAGDTVYVKAGTYVETPTFPRSGSAGSPIVLRNFGTDAPIVDGNGTNGNVLTISSKSNVQVIGLEIQNAVGGDPSIGISIDGSGSNVLVKNCKVHDIASLNKNAHGIAVYGTEATAITNLVLDGNEVYDCKLGQSESIVINANVDGFQVVNNVVHDNDNIGIDCIGYEGNAPASVDQARNGLVAGNRVYNISSKTNPTYGGEQSADGIYVDGGKDIIIERNSVDNCDIGIEIASEHGGKATSGITVRNNFVSRSFQGNVMSGGYAANRGSATDVVIVNNTTYQGGDGEILLQYNNDGITVKNNVLYAKSGNEYVFEANNNSNNANVVVDNNLYYGSDANSSGTWEDAHGIFANPQLASTYVDMHLTAGSPAVNAGVDLGGLSGSEDVDGEARTFGSAIDLGADELGSTVGVSPRACKNDANGIVRSFVQNAQGITLSLDLSSSALVSHRVVDVSGKVVVQSAVRSTSTNLHRVEISTAKLAQGRYVLSVSAGTFGELNVPFAVSR